MKTKKIFINNAIKNGYNNVGCNGWDWIRENIKELDYIFQSEEYKLQDGMKFKCMPILRGDDELSELEIRVLETAWYLNNQRVREQKEKEQLAKLAEMGFSRIESDKKYDGKKVEFIKDTSGDIFGGWQKSVGKLKWSPTDKKLMTMKSKYRRRGYWIDGSVYIKFL